MTPGQKMSHTPNRDFCCFYPCEIIRIYHEYEGGIEKSVTRITGWYHEAREGLIFLSHPHTNYGFFFLFTTKYSILYWENMKKGFRQS